jgi:hypothetical protein
MTRQLRLEFLKLFVAMAVVAQPLGFHPYGPMMSLSSH